MTGFLIIASLIVAVFSLIGAINVWYAKKHPERVQQAASFTDYNINSPSTGQRPPFAR